MSNREYGLKSRSCRKQLLGHALVTVPYWEWEGCKKAGEREQYLRDKLADCVQTPGNAVSET